MQESLYQPAKISFDEEVTQEMKKDISKLWKKLELKLEWQERNMKMNCCISSRRKSMDKVKWQFINKLLVLLSSGITAVINFEEATQKN